MTFRKTGSRDISVTIYPPVTRILHWLVAVLVLLTWPLGFTISFISKEWSLDFYMIHESLGFLVLWIMLVRVGNKLTAEAPEAEGNKLERFAASTVHGLLYAFLIIMPVSGFLATNAHGFPFEWFGLVPIWSPIGKSPEIAGILSGIHWASAWILLGLFGAHIGAVLLHHVIKRDLTLYKIL
ncbi:cytochrome b [Pseudohoeflea suaedae]|uniref:Cytochrome b n=1 Tax=Pseudohoeflea suaedae TaxID=877384 RepID=A0A4V3A6X3_9HYPH|nr:cytochrome b [Pseudohoeflea suaedae]TDH34928.1 cytochrome b [Pseudohoeflea suaedae]